MTRFIGKNYLLPTASEASKQPKERYHMIVTGVKPFVKCLAGDDDVVLVARDCAAYLLRSDLCICYRCCLNYCGCDHTLAALLVRAITQFSGTAPMRMSHETDRRRFTPWRQGMREAIDEARPIS